MVTGLQTASGEMVSSTVTSAEQEAWLPWSSTTVSTTCTVPRSSQSNTERSVNIVAMPELSKLPPSMSPATIEARPSASRYTVSF